MLTTIICSSSSHTVNASKAGSSSPLVHVFCAFQDQGRNLEADHRLHEKFPTRFKVKVRDLVVWLPPGYAADTPRRYPVLYMHDSDSAFANWRLDETASALIHNNQLDPFNHCLCT